jgi:outer membrane murein-binding lipoprotein Lpp
MKSNKVLMLWTLLVVFCLLPAGCGKKADENKPMSEVKAEAEKMNVQQLRETAIAYQEAVKSKTSEVDKIEAKIKELAPADLLGSKASELKAKIDAFNKSKSALIERFQVYYDELKKKGGDLTGLQL